MEDGKERKNGKTEERGKVKQYIKKETKKWRPKKKHTYKKKRKLKHTTSNKLDKQLKIITNKASEMKKKKKTLVDIHTLNHLCYMCSSIN